MFASPGAIAFQIPAIFGFGPFPVRWYGILMATSIVVGLWVAHRQAKREGLPAAGLRSVRVLPSDVPVRVDLGLCRVRGAGDVAAPVVAPAPRRALLLLHRPLLDRALRHRGAAARQLLARQLPRAAGRERARR